MHETTAGKTPAITDQEKGVGTVGSINTVAARTRTGAEVVTTGVHHHVTGIGATVERGADVAAAVPIAAVEMCFGTVLIKDTAAVTYINITALYSHVDLAPG